MLSKLCLLFSFQQNTASYSCLIFKLSMSRRPRQQFGPEWMNPGSAPMAVWLGTSYLNFLCFSFLLHKTGRVATCTSRGRWCEWFCSAPRALHKGYSVGSHHGKQSLTQQVLTEHCGQLLWPTTEETKKALTQSYCYSVPHLETWRLPALLPLQSQCPILARALTF